jgi:hypothetical protein
LFFTASTRSRSPQKSQVPQNGGFASWRMAVIVLWDQIIIQMNTRFAWMTSVLFSTSWRIKGLSPSLGTRSTGRSNSADNSRCIRPSAKNPILASGSNSTNRSISLSGRKPARKTEPNYAKDFTWLRWQKSIIFACGMEIRDRLIC